MTWVWAAVATTLLASVAVMVGEMGVCHVVALGADRHGTRGCRWSRWRLALEWFAAADAVVVVNAVTEATGAAQVVARDADRSAPTGKLWPAAESTTTGTARDAFAVAMLKGCLRV